MRGRPRLAPCLPLSLPMPAQMVPRCAHLRRHLRLQSYLGTRSAHAPIPLRDTCLSANSGSAKDRLWIVDEASLLSARDTAKLLSKAETEGARVLLVGDVKQLGSVEAGAAFAQLQAAGMATPHLTTIVRQTDDDG